MYEKFFSLLMVVAILSYGSMAIASNALLDLLTNPQAHKQRMALAKGLAVISGIGQVAMIGDWARDVLYQQVLKQMFFDICFDVKTNTVKEFDEQMIEQYLASRIGHSGRIFIDFVKDKSRTIQNIVKQWRVNANINDAAHNQAYFVFNTFKRVEQCDRKQDQFFRYAPWMRNIGASGALALLLTPWVASGATSLYHGVRSGLSSIMPSVVGRWRSAVPH